MTDQAQRFKVHAAHKNALRDLPLFRNAQLVYGKTLQETAEDVPPSLGVAHVACYNPALSIKPQISKEGRRGFLKLTHDVASVAGVAWEDFDTPEVCAFAWNYGLNTTGKDFWGDYSLMFAAPNADFWNTVYIRFLLGAPNFIKVWNVRDPSQRTVLDSLIYGVLAARPNLAGWNTVTLTQFFSYALPYVTFLWTRGSKSLTGGYGKLPSPPRTTVTTAFLE